MKFPYFLFRGFYFPVIPVTIISTLGKSIKTSALIDSGASISLFHASIGRKIDIPIEIGEKRTFQSATGRLVGYLHGVKIRIGKEEIKCKIAFSDELTTSFNLLGRENFFDQFLITFNEKAKIIELRKF